MEGLDELDLLSITTIRALDPFIRRATAASESHDDSLQMDLK